ncbi:MAG: hypothetical protein ACM3NQ_00705 [Bacteroidales bacterium]
MRGFRLLAVLPTLVATVLVGAPAFANQGKSEKAFVPGGRIRLDLAAAEYTIKAGQDDRIVVSWTTEDDPDVRVRVSIQTDIARKTATVTTGGAHSVRAVIEVPALTDLHIDITAGNLRVQGITGSKDVGSWAGNIDIDVPKPDDYRLMDLAVKAGDIKARDLGVKMSGLFRSFRRSGPGKYTLRVRLTAGNLRLLPAELPSVSGPAEPPRAPTNPRHGSDGRERA